MKNKKVKLAVLVLAAVTLFTATAFAAGSTNNGYEALKQIMKDSGEDKLFSNATFNGTFQLTDNGAVIAEAAGTAKGTLEAKAGSGNARIKLMGKEQNLSFYKNGKETYLVDETNSKYYQMVNMDQGMNYKPEAARREYGSGVHKMDAAGEAFMDYFVGDLKSQFELSENNDGSRTITLDLDQKEIPAPINLLIGAAAESSGYEHDRNMYSTADGAQKEILLEKLPFLKQFEGVEKEMPKLKHEVKLTGLVMVLHVDENSQLKSFDMKVGITGKDVNEVYHELSFSGSMSVADVNKTTVEQFNTEGKTIETIDCAAFKAQNRD